MIVDGEFSRQPKIIIFGVGDEGHLKGEASAQDRRRQIRSQPPAQFGRHLRGHLLNLVARNSRHAQPANFIKLLDETNGFQAKHIGHGAILEHVALFSRFPFRRETTNGE